MYNYWVWAQSQRSKSSVWVVMFWELLKLLNNDDEKCIIISTVNYLDV